MPIILKAEETRPLREGPGWVEILLAGEGQIGEAAISTRRWSFELGAVGPQVEHGDYDEMIYVISGNGQAFVGGRQLPLQPESVLWLEAGDRYHIQAGPEGLELIQGYAPGEVGADEGAPV